MEPKKELVAPEEVVRSVLALRAELLDKYENKHHMSTTTAEILFKLNSCLYSKYPHK